MHNNTRNYIWISILAALMASSILTGCSLYQTHADTSSSAAATASTESSIVERIPGYEAHYPGVNSAAGILGSTAGVSDTYTFITISDIEYTVDLNKDALGNPYQKSDFWRSGDVMSYVGEGYTAELGIDVSDHNGTIDWNAVKELGVQFAFIRAGYRGYTEGGIHADEQFRANIIAARKAGIPVGAYFFSQAINEAEAIEEAQFVLDLVKDYGLQLPIVYDPETIADSAARTTGLSREQLTANALAFCSEITDGGYEPCLYVNNMWQAYSLAMEEFNDIQIWLADYRDQPQSPYHFEYWQYSFRGNGSRIGSDTDVDMDIRIIPDRLHTPQSQDSGANENKALVP